MLLGSPNALSERAVKLNAVALVSIKVWSRGINEEKSRTLFDAVDEMEQVVVSLLELGFPHHGVAHLGFIKEHHNAGESGVDRVASQRTE